MPLQPMPPLVLLPMLPLPPAMPLPRRPRLLPPKLPSKQFQPQRLPGLVPGATGPARCKSCPGFLFSRDWSNAVS